jgi:hypothetical protein
MINREQTQLTDAESSAINALESLYWARFEEIFSDAIKGVATQTISRVDALLTPDM